MKDCQGPEDLLGPEGTMSPVWNGAWRGGTDHVRCATSGGKFAGHPNQRNGTRPKNILINQREVLIGRGDAQHQPARSEIPQKGPLLMLHSFTGSPAESRSAPKYGGQRSLRRASRRVRCLLSRTRPAN